LISVTDPRGRATLYTYDGLGDVIRLDSPDTGVTVYEHNAAAELIRATDARGVVTEYAYDALDRVTAKTFPASPTDNVLYEYDDAAPGNRGIGRLRRITDKSGSTEFTYDVRGNVVSATRTIGGRIYVTRYAYDLADRLASVTYPSGRIIDYQRDQLGRVSSLYLRNGTSAAPIALASSLNYRPFGPLESLIYGNGVTLTLSYDQDYRLTAIETAGSTAVQDLGYGYDDAGNIVNIADALDLARQQTFQYD
jgi:YD repeat-containing protein